MTLREDIEQMLATEVHDDPVWAKLAHAGSEGHVLVVSGPLDETLQSVVNALMTYSDALLHMVLRLADAVDELSARVQSDG